MFAFSMMLGRKACQKIVEKTPIKTRKKCHEFDLLEEVLSFPHVLCVDTGRSSETAKAHRG
eukprot:TRINITY_DN6809_c0_g1_i1.p2 TRINITY_DN6809_c0_g1~~TRINITY_DN6809_c0_g1_i1.p2  ORF type:complete len:61 (+),score=9.94 TRINITY_DN6809_c0_g1_i1:350-532(+)